MKVLVMVLLMAAAASGCDDPVRRREIAALGSETPGVEPGAFHRPGQPCLVCHADEGDATPMTVAGTVFRDSGHGLAAGGVRVELLDADHRSAAAVTNCAGNFFLTARDFVPRFPVWATLRRGDLVVDMESPLNKNGDCGACHREAKDRTSAGRVFLTDDPSAFALEPTAGCP